ncbi:hypothetical protein TSACC_22015 [Terrimicrobium sacchariphilum]|uniref:3-keto-disaccharide hydrolase domain-containing protein n=1 Tax=Terrimicrobium sacchariphilum TaxID=690879 RepID=A0A146GAE3_TERSA|nr:hypothetical protein [Terrimicrobium sacchariphilum]GAT33598.1 hypothetical protein TSACC_22015 [Terrimicrobium sacchariphilum]
MNTRPLLVAFSFLAVTAFADEAIFQESILELPKTKGWKTLGTVQAQGGRLVLNAAGDEGNFANGVLMTTEGVEALNFTEHPLQIKLSGLEMSGDAPESKKAFVVLLSTDRNSETSSAYVRFCLNGDGSFNVASPRGGGGENVPPVDVLNGKVMLPVSMITISLSREQVTVKIKDASGEQEFSGEVGDKIDLSLWQGTSPYFVLKAVRRPAAGFFEASVGGLEVVSQ